MPTEGTRFDWRQFWLDSLWPLPVFGLILWALIRHGPRMLWEAEKAYWRRIRDDYTVEVHHA